MEKCEGKKSQETQMISKTGWKMTEKMRSTSIILQKNFFDWLFSFVWTKNRRASFHDLAPTVFFCTVCKTKSKMSSLYYIPFFLLFCVCVFVCVCVCECVCVCVCGRGGKRGGGRGKVFLYVLVFVSACVRLCACTQICLAIHTDLSVTSLEHT